MEVEASHSGKPQGTTDGSLLERRGVDAERKFQILLESIPSGIAMVDSCGKIVLCNTEIQKMFGYAADELIGQSIEVLVPFRSRNVHGKVRDHFIDRPEKRQMGAGRDLSGLRKNGVEFPVEIGLNHLQIGGETFVVASVVDITARKEIEAKLHHVYQEIQQKNLEMEQFVYTVSHDLKSPLVTSMSFLGFMREDLEQKRLEDVMDSLGRLERAYRKMQELIEDLLQLSRVGRVDVHFENVDLNDVFKAIEEFIAEALQKAKTRFVVATDLPVIWADRKRVHQVFENLILNAIKYATSGPAPEIRIIWRDLPDEVWVCVKDNGPGIEKQYHTKIFGLFQRLQADSEGTGVGLAIVTRAMQLHNGRAWVESELGKGAEFWVAFPKTPQEE
jgi:PAS domain S-box-containing protein